MGIRFKLSIAILVVLVVSAVYAATSYRVNVAQCVQINEHSTCNDVQNASCSSDIFVPTNTSTEWSNFRTNKPACITLWSGCGKNCTM